jgi:hypothetical protein
MEEAPQNGKESSHSAHANGMNEWCSIKMYKDVLFWQTIIKLRDTSENVFYLRQEEKFCLRSIFSKLINLQHNYVPNFPEIEQ